VSRQHPVVSAQVALWDAVEVELKLAGETGAATALEGAPVACVPCELSVVRKDRVRSDSLVGTEAREVDAGRGAVACTRAVDRY
jgi:hypothetical protein